MMKGKLLIKQPAEQSFHPLKTTTKLVFRERCRHCGCTHNNPCYHPKYGFCWWEDSKHTICYDVRIDCSLTEEIDAVKLACLFLEYADELAADDLSLLLRICNALKKSEETVCCIYIYKVCAELVAEYLHNILGLSFAHETVVYVNAVKLVAD